MKIALVVPGFSADESDWCIPALLDLVRTLAGSSGVQVHVFPLRYPHHRQPYRVFGAEVWPQGGGTRGGLGRLPFLAGALARIVVEHRRGPFDLLHAYWADEPGFVAVTAAGALRIPAIVSLAGGELVGFRDIGYGGQLHPVNRWMTGHALRRARQVTVGSTYLARLAERHVPPSRLSVVPLGVDTGRFTPQPAAGERSPLPRENPQTVNILHVASLVPVKDQTTLLAALAQVHATVPDVRLDVVGDGPLINTLREHAAALGLATLVSFHRPVEHDALPPFYRAADFCVLSSRHEAQGMVALEAAACGRTTVGTAVGIVPELSSQLNVAPGDVPGLARLLATLASDRSLVDDLGRRAQRTVRAEYSLEVGVERLLGLYRDVLARR